ILGCSNGNDSDDDASPANPFVEKTFYGSQTIGGKEYDVCELKFTSATDVTLTLYGQEENGSDKVETLKYTVSDGKASVTYNEKKITTSAIKDDTFTASLDGTDETACTFSTTPGKKYQGSTPDPDPTPTPNPDLANPFAGKTFYGSYTFEFGKYDIYELQFTSGTKVTMIAYGLSEDGSDVFMPGSYTVASGKATIEFDEKDYDTITTSVITNDTFIIGEEPDITLFSKTPGTKITEAPEPEDPDTPDTDETILDKAGIASAIDSWIGSPLTKVDGTTYTYEFTATEESVQFAVQKIKGEWGVKWCAATISAKDASTENVNIPSEKVSLVYNGGDENAKITNLSVNSKYLLTIIIDDEATNAISATVTLKEYITPPPKPTVYSLEGLTFKGAWDTYWSDTRTLTADETQTIEITATNAGNDFGIFGSGGNVWEGTGIPFGTEIELTYKKDGGSNSTMASNFEVGKAYIVVLKVIDNSLSAPRLTITITEKTE
ncbi:MAG: hypothetical protein K2M99_01625, partial [Treponemataceae bacterium]|nr:hypothetical protein [Treponemataceae bacterium]